MSEVSFISVESSKSYLGVIFNALNDIKYRLRIKSWKVWLNFLRMDNLYLIIVRITLKTILSVCTFFWSSKKKQP